ncbi:MAG: (2Fe-2S)-binding protein [Planctomycetota bacterium]|nr:(2Fe-2S)-binding protein [Planctomycetota bacterium]
MKAIFDDAQPIELTLIVNGDERRLSAPPLRRLLDVLREDIALTGTKEGCGEGECGACTVLVDGRAELSCLVPCCQVNGCDVRTIEHDNLASIQDAFLEHGGAQCGICTPGMIVMTRAYLDQCERDKSSATIDGAREALAGNLCRCTGYEKILASVLHAARAERAR